MDSMSTTHIHIVKKNYIHNFNMEEENKANVVKKKKSLHPGNLGGDTDL